MNKPLTLLTVILCGLLCQCASTRSHPNHALLISERTGDSGEDLTPLIRQLDGRDVTPGESKSGILLQPGPHSIVAGARRNVGRESVGRWLGGFGRKIGEKFDDLRTWHSEREIDFTARAGSNYVLKARQGTPMRLWLEEE